MRKPLITNRRPEKSTPHRKRGDAETNPPPILYTYLKAEYAFGDIRDMRLKVSEANKTNDLLEYSWNIVSRKHAEDARWIALKKEEQFKYQQDYAEQLKFICCCKSPVNHLLWAHYGDNHKGVCLGLSINLKVAGQSCIKQVLYENPVKIYVDKAKTEQKGIELIDKVLRTKRKEWAGEKEWRIQIPVDHHRLEQAQDGRIYFRIRETEIKEIIFGAQCSAVDVGRIAMICCERNLHVKLSQVVCDTGRLDLVNEELSSERLNSCSLLSFLDRLRKSQIVHIP